MSVKERGTIWGPRWAISKGPLWALQPLLASPHHHCLQTYGAAVGMGWAALETALQRPPAHFLPNTYCRAYFGCWQSCVIFMAVFK